MDLSRFTEIWLVDFEFRAPNGNRPEPVCLVAREWRTKRLIRTWLYNADAPEAPIALGPSVLYVAYYASAEFGCHLAMNWPMPVYVLDLFAEFRNLTNGKPIPCGNGLIGALTYYGLDSIAAAEKAEMRELALRGGTYTEAEQTALLDYCQSDVDALDRLLTAMAPTIDFPRALLRGRYMVAAARMEATGTPIDTETLELLRENWVPIQSELISAVDKEFGVYVPTNQRKIDQATRIGAALIDTSAEYSIDAHRLAEAVEYLHDREREADREHQEAVKAARRATGLTVNRIAQHERQGRFDYASFPGLDTRARELAAEYPALAIGQGYDTGAAYEGTDYAGRLWELLRQPDRTPRTKHDPGLLRDAAELVAAEPEITPSAGSMSFSVARFSAWLASNGIPWTRLESGELALDDDTFRQMSKAYPQVAPLRELRHTLSELRLESLAVGTDGRNRCLLSAFRARTGRNQPSNSRFIYGPSCWLRGLIQPHEHRALAYIDWSAQEIAIAAALSGDPAMRDAYAAGDPYLYLAQFGGFAPKDATKKTHGAIRDVFKIVYLASNYGMQAKSLSQLIGQSEAHATELLRLHRQAFPTFWRWSDGAVDHAMLYGWLATVFGWRIQVGPDARPTSLRNFLVQGNGAEMLRLACCLATERGIEVCCPVHDALLIEADEDRIDQATTDCQAAMAEAGRIVLGGFDVRTDAKIVRYPDRYMDPRGERMWDAIGGILDGLPPLEGCAGAPLTCSAGAPRLVAQA